MTISTTTTPLRRGLRTIVLLSVLLLSFSAGAFALDLKTALSKGLAGEVDNGYLAQPPGASGEAQQLIASVNSERRKAYKQIAEKNETTQEIAGAVTFEKRYPEFLPGTWVKIEGRWSQK